MFTPKFIRIGIALAGLSAGSVLAAPAAAAPPVPPPAVPATAVPGVLPTVVPGTPGTATTPSTAASAAGGLTAVTVPTSAARRASGLPWSDGGYFAHDSAQADAFAAWRGRPVDNIVAFTHRQTWPALLEPWWTTSLPAGFDASRDDFILSVPLWTDDGDAGSDAQWTQLATATTAVDPDAFMRVGWEMNCCFSLATDQDAWRTQFTRAATLLKAAAPELQIVFNPNEGASSNNTVTDPSVLFVDGLIDIVAIDAYDWYPAYTDEASWAQHRDKQFGWNHWYDFARSKNLPFAVAEFGVSAASTDTGGDNPAYFQHAYGWLMEKATTTPGSIAFVSIFNEPAEYCLCQLYPTTANPAAGERYRDLLAELAGAAPAPPEGTVTGPDDTTPAPPAEPDSGLSAGDLPASAGTPTG
ncbi:hypothetical protein AB0368_06870 [Actinoplanes sp. NPDC051475]|uniref:hypothetical protein n=1 Tax=Actinoplanes sp. NPDC051475 TaxID=3157225 RepID=UPI00344BC140